MHSVAIAVLLTATSAAAQAVVHDPVKIADAEKLIDTFQGEPLRCEVDPMKPRFSFSLKLQTGYVYRVPLNQYRGAGHHWVVLTRVTPQEGDQRPVYLSDEVRLPPVPNTDMEAEVGGSYWLGEGHYTVKSLLFDDSNRACRREWQIDARLRSGERKVEPLMAPHTVAGLSWRTSPPTDGANSGDLSRVTILLDAAAVFPLRTMLSASDQGLLLDFLSALVEALPARSVKLVVFHLDLQKEVFRREGFTIDAMPEVAQAMNELQPSLVDYSVLQKPGGALDLIESLTNFEIRAPEASDAVIFLGPRTRYTAKIPPGALDQPRGAAPRFFYLQCAPRPYGLLTGLTPGGPMAAGSEMGRSPMGFPLAFPNSNYVPDSIENAVARLKGRTMVAALPEDFAKAVAEVKRAMRTRK